MTPLGGPVVPDWEEKKQFTYIHVLTSKRTNIMVTSTSLSNSAMYKRVTSSYRVDEGAAFIWYLSSYSVYQIIFRNVFAQLHELGPLQ